MAKFADFGHYADPTAITTAPTHIQSLMDVMVAGPAAGMFWGSLACAAAPIAIALIAKKANGSPLAFASIAGVVVLAGSVLFRVLITCSATRSCCCTDMQRFRRAAFRQAAGMHAHDVRRRPRSQATPHIPCNRARRVVSKETGQPAPPSSSRFLRYDRSRRTARRASVECDSPFLPPFEAGRSNPPGFSFSTALFSRERAYCRMSSAKPTR